jgi:hypothetical protein
MATARIHLDARLPAAEALARASSLFATVDAEQPVLLYGAELDGAAVVLGAYQHAPHALRAEAFEAIALPVVRRVTGGAAVWGGQGVLYLALGLCDASALMPCPPGRILNRNVRGLLAGLRALGAAANYFGRDFVSFGTEPGAYVGWHEARDGRVLLEAFVALDAAFTPADELGGYPARREPALRGKRPTTLRAAGVTQSAVEVLSSLAEGYAKSFKLELSAVAPSDAELARAKALRAERAVSLTDERGLCWSSPLQEAIGFVSAGVSLDARGMLSALELGGDFYQHEACPQQLASRLVGSEPRSEIIGAALDAVYAARPGSIEGVRNLHTLQSAILDAVHAAARPTL